MTDMDNLKRLVAFKKRKEMVKAELDEIQSEMNALEEKCLVYFTNQGIKQMRVDDKTVFLKRGVFAGTADGATKAQILDALRTLGLDNIITFNHQSLSGFVRETAQTHPELVDNKGSITADPEKVRAVLPYPLNELLKVTEDFTLQIRK